MKLAVQECGGDFVWNLTFEYDFSLKNKCLGPILDLKWHIPSAYQFSQFIYPPPPPLRKNFLDPQYIDSRFLSQMTIQTLIA